MSKFDNLLKQLGTGKWNLTVFLSVCYCLMYFLVINSGTPEGTFTTVWEPLILSIISFAEQLESFTGVLLIPGQSLGPVFFAPELDHTCSSTEIAAFNITNTTRSQCMYLATTSEGNVEERLCTKWDFDDSVYSRTLTSEFQLVCDYTFLRPTFKSVYFFGGMIGAPFAGYLSDRYGRKTILVVATVSYTILSNILCWLPDIFSILFVRLLLGSLAPTSVHAGFTLSMETCEPRYRAVVGIMIFFPWTVALMLLGGIGFLIRDWRWLMFVISLPMFLFLPVLCFLDESPRWLIVRGRHNEAYRVLQKAARWNGVQIPSEEELYATMEHIQKEAHGRRRSDASLTDVRTRLKRIMCEAVVLVRTKRIRAITLCLYLDYLVLGAVYYGLSIGGDKLGVNPFAYMAVGGVMEIPGSTLTIPMVEKIGRRTSSIWCFVLTAGSLLTLGVTPADLSWLVVTLTMIGRMTITGAYQIIYLHASELFPTEVRQRGMGTASMVAKLGSVSAPYLVENLSTVGAWLPLVVFGGAALVAGVNTINLPETRGRHMADTVADFEASDTCSS